MKNIEVSNNINLESWYVVHLDKFVNFCSKIHIAFQDYDLG